MKTHFYTLLIILFLIPIHNLFAQTYASYGIIVAGAKNCIYGRDLAHLNHPWGVSLDTNGNIYVADLHNNRIQRWAPGAKRGITVAGQNDTIAGYDSSHLHAPTNLFVDSKGNIYVADAGNSRIQKWVPGSNYGTTVAGSSISGGSDSAHLGSPYGVFVDKSGNVFVSDLSNHRVQVWAPGAKYGITVAGQKNGKSGTDASHLHNPWGLFVDDSGYIYVCDAYNNRVQKWVPGAKSGVTVAGQADCSIGFDSTHLNNPTGIYVDHSGNLFIVDCFNNRIQKWARGVHYGTTIISQSGTYQFCDSTNLNQPYGIASDKYGNLYVAEANGNRVTKWNLASGSATTNITLSASLFTVYPNPNNGSFTLDITSGNHTDKAHVQLLNMLGQVSYEQMVDNVNGNIHTTISNLALPAGIYLVRVVIRGESAVQRIVITN